MPDRGAAGANIGTFLNKLNADERASEEKRDHKIAERADREAVRERQAAKQNERLEREKQEAIQRADTVVQNCKAEYEQKVRKPTGRKTGQNAWSRMQKWLWHVNKL